MTRNKTGDSPKKPAALEFPDPSYTLKGQEQRRAAGMLGAVDYLTGRGLPATIVDTHGIEFLHPNVICDLLGLGVKNEHRSAHVGVWLPAWGPELQVIEGYGHALLFTKISGSDRYIRARPSANKEKRAQDLIWMPPLDGKPWAEQNIGRLVIICESWIKAFVLSQLGFLTIALNGVDGACNGGGRDGPLVSGFDHPIWKDRQFHVAILSDSISVTNPNSAFNVKAARTALASRLVNKGVVTSDHIWDIWAPPPPTGWAKGDWGVDDMYVHPDYGPDKILEMVAKRVPANLLSPEDLAIDAVSEDYIWIEKVDRALSKFDGSLITRVGMQNALSDRTFEELVPNSKGEWELQRVPVAPAWFRSPRHDKAYGLSFRPGLPDKIEVSRGERTKQNYNMWRGLAVSPWLEGEPEGIGATERVERLYVNFLHEAMGREDAEALLDIYASLVQQPERIVTCSIRLFGPSGTGKNFDSTAMKLIFGDHYVSLTAEQYANKFNSSKRLARVINIEEEPAFMEEGDAANYVAQLKQDADPALTTRQVEPKGRDLVEIDRCVTVRAMSNNWPPYVIDAGLQRRLFLALFGAHMATTDRPGGTKTAEWWKERWTWLYSTGARDLLTWLLARDISHFDPEANVHKTKWLRAAILRDSTRNIDSFAVAIINETVSTLIGCGVPDEIAKAVTHMTARDVWRLYQAANPGTTLTEGKVGRVLMNHVRAEALRRVKFTRGAGATGVTRTEEPYEFVRSDETGNPFDSMDQLRGWLLGVERASLHMPGDKS